MAAALTFFSPDGLYADEAMVMALDIASQQAVSALLELSRKSGSHIVLAENVGNEIRLPALRGEYTLSAALDEMLKGTGLIYEFVADNSVVVKRAAKAESEKRADNLSRFGLEEIIVTATRRETTLQDTPLSVSALTTTEMARQGIENFEDFARQVPGVVLTGVKNFSKFTIRGVQTSATYSSNGEQKPVAVYIDEVPISTFSIVTPDLMAAQGFRRAHPNIGFELPNTVDPNDPTIVPVVGKSDSLWNYEIGAKTTWLDGRLQADIAAYFIIWDDIQISATRFSDAAPYTTNAGDAETRGLEAEFTAWLFSDFQFGLNLTLAKSEIVSLTQEDAVLSGAIKGSEIQIGCLAAPASCRQ